MTISTAGLVTWTPAAAGDNSVIITVSDGRGGNVNQSFNLTAVTALSPSPPTISSNPTGPAVVGLPYQYQVVASDPNGSVLSYSLTTAPSGMSIDPQSGLLTWTPQAGDVGSQHVVIAVDDALVAGVTQTFDLPVVTQPAAPDTPPTITSQVPSNPIDAGNPYQYQVTAVDPDGDPLTWQIDSGFQGMNLDPQSGLFTWTPPAGTSGNFPVTVSVSDGRGGVAQQPFDDRRCRPQHYRHQSSAHHQFDSPRPGSRWGRRINTRSSPNIPMAMRSPIRFPRRRPACRSQIPAC